MYDQLQCGVLVELHGEDNQFGFCKEALGEF